MENTNDGIHTIISLDYTIDEDNQTIFVKNFEIPYINNKSLNSFFNITTSNTPFKYKQSKMNMVFIPNKNQNIM
jgi:hypothetical protein